MVSPSYASRLLKLVISRIRLRCLLRPCELRRALRQKAAAQHLSFTVNSCSRGHHLYLWDPNLKGQIPYHYAHALRPPSDGTTDAYEMHASAHAQRVSSAAVNAARRHGPIRLSAVTLHAPDTWPFRVEGTRKSYHNSSTVVVHELQVCVHVRLRISPL